MLRSLMVMSLAALVVLLVPSCGGDGGGASTSDAAADTGSAEFLLTSAAFADGATIPAEHTCNGGDISPALEWESPPEGTMSYALLLYDVSADLTHSAIWNIDASATSLPEGIEPAYYPSNVQGAMQCSAWNGALGYSGPCPPAKHTYEFHLFALDVENLTNLGPDSFLREVMDEVQKHSLDVAVLSGTYGP